MAFWVDHVMRFGGSHLYSPAQEMSFIELFMLDVIFILMAIGFSLSISMYYGTKYIIAKRNKVKTD